MRSGTGEKWVGGEATNHLDPTNPSKSQSVINTPQMFRSGGICTRAHAGAHRRHTMRWAQRPQRDPNFNFLSQFVTITSYLLLW